MALGAYAWSMTILVLQHSEHGTPGRLGATLRDHGFRLDIRRGDVAPVGSAKGVPLDLDDIHGLILMGGPQNVTDLEKLPWMAAEMDLIRKAHARQLPVIGICLGAQMIAHALGGTVAPREKPAVGLYDMEVTVPGQTDTLMAGVPWKSPQLFSCGQEVKTPPPGATVLCGSKQTKTIAYRVGLRTFGCLAHFECDRPMLDQLMAGSRGDMAGANTTESEVKVQADQWYQTYARVSDRLCVNLASQLFPLVKRLSA